MATDALQEALLSAWTALASSRSERFPPEIGGNRPNAAVGTANPEQDQQFTAAVPTVPTVPTKKQDIQHHDAEAWAAWEERAAIREFDGDMERPLAEALTAVEMGVKPAPEGMHGNFSAIIENAMHSQESLRNPISSGPY